MPTILDVIATEHQNIIASEAGFKPPIELSIDSSSDQGSPDATEVDEQTLRFNFKPYIEEIVEPLKPEQLNRDPIFLYYKQFIIDTLELN